MAISESETLQPVQQVTTHGVAPARRGIGLLHCLIVSASPARRELFVDAATGSGWETVVCTSAAAASRYLGKRVVHLGIVDLEHPAPPEFSDIVESLAGSKNVLLIVCGNEGDLEEEIWVRQLGAWLYLPGARDSEGLAVLCEEAQHIAKRIAPANRVASGSDGENNPVVRRRTAGK